MRQLALVLLVLGVFRSLHAADSPAATRRWIPLNEANEVQVLGLPWYPENRPHFWRMPATKIDSLPKGVQNRSRCPSGGRLVFRSTTTSLAVRVQTTGDAAVKTLDVFVDGQMCPSVKATRNPTSAELVLFENQPAAEKEIVIYLPHGQEVVITAIGLDVGAELVEATLRFARPLPVVFYGSSVCQGSGANHPSKAYPALLGRDLNVDFVNLGFGGAGKAEPEVVELVNSIPGCCYVFDLGKSYGDQDASAFRAMLQAIRRSHPQTPLIVITPITSLKETQDPEYSKRSLHTRAVMREPVEELVRAGDQQLVLVEGEDLLGFQDHHLLSKDGVHPSDEGFVMIATRLRPILEKSLQLPAGRR